MIIRKGLSDDEMDNSTTELQVTEDCLEDEVDDGEVWEGVNASEIEGDMMEKSSNSSHEHLVHLESDVCSDDSSRVVAFFFSTFIQVVIKIQHLNSCSISFNSHYQLCLYHCR